MTLCSIWKHVWNPTHSLCNCGAILIFPTADGTAHVARIVGVSVVDALAASSVSAGAQQTCPKCNGQGHVSTPPGIPGDVATYPANSTNSYRCRVCGGSGLVSAGAGQVRADTIEKARETFVAMRDFAATFLGEQPFGVAEYKLDVLARRIIQHSGEALAALAAVRAPEEKADCGTPGCTHVDCSAAAGLAIDYYADSDD